MVNLLEKYRPNTLNDIYGQKFITDKMTAYIQEIIRGEGDGNFPHFFFEGPPGTGKTATVHATLWDAFGADYTINLLEKNASNVLIAELRTEIIDFAEKDPIGDYTGEDGNLYEVPFNIIFLDEVDRLSRDSQQLLRRTMETCAKETRFILSCNYKNKVIDAIQSRCTCLHFKRLKPKSLRKLMKKVAFGEGWEVTEGAYKLLSENVKGDARRAISILELGARTGSVDEDEIRRCTPIIMEQFNTDILKIAMSANRKYNSEYEKDFRILEANLDKLYYDEGFSPQQIVINIFESTISDEEMPNKLKRVIYETISECNRDIHLVDEPLYAIKFWLRGLKI